MNRLRTVSFFDVYEKHAFARGDSCALCLEDREITYKELFAETAKFARGLEQLGLAPGSRIAVLCKNHPAFFHLFGAAAALNLTLVLVNRRLSREEMSYIVEDTTPSLMICDAEMAELGQSLTEHFSCLKTCFILDDPLFMSLYNNDPLEQARPHRPEDPFVIIHTAAVQGKPRGAVLGQENVMLANMQLMHALQLDGTKNYLNILPLFHIMGLNLGLGLLQVGGKNTILEKFDPLKALHFIAEKKVNVFGSFPPIVAHLIDKIEENDFDLSSLETVIGLEVPETVEKWQHLTNATFWTMYGQTETSGLITFSEYLAKPGSAGEVSFLADIKIVDDYDTVLPAGQIGEIVVRGPLVFQGYWQEDGLNAYTFRSGMHHTGDLGMLDSQGFLFFKGRKAEKELIKPGGENVFPAEVEKAVLAHQAIREVCVFGVPDPRFGEGIKAVCSLNEGCTITKDELITFCGTLIAGYKKPRYIEFIDDLPKNEDGTIDRATIKERYR